PRSAFRPRISPNSSSAVTMLHPGVHPGLNSTSTSTSLRAGSKSSRTTDPKNDSLRMPHFRQNSAIRSWGMGMASSRAAGMSFILLAGIDFARGEHLLDGGDERLQFIVDRESTGLNSSHRHISYGVLCWIRH